MQGLSPNYRKDGFLILAFLDKDVFHIQCLLDAIIIGISRTIKFIHQNNQLEKLLTMRESKIQTSNYKLVKLGVKFQKKF